MKSRVKDVMSREIKSLPPDMNARDALKTLIETDISGLPVINGDGKLLGVFTEREVLKAIMPVYVTQVGAFIYGEDSKSEIKKIAQLDKILVKDLMRKDVPTVDEETSITEASKIMLTKSERRIIVVKDKKAVGVITRCDVVRALAKEAGVVL